MITALYAGMLGLMLIGLSIVVIKGRRANKIALGDGQQHDLMKRMRAHANFVEYAPMFLLLLAMAEINGLTAYLVHFLAIVFIAGRIMHALSILRFERYDGAQLISVPIWRVRGMMCTFMSIGLLAGINIMLYGLKIIH